MSLPRIAIVGAANVGKSTLFNRLLGRRRSLVADEPGLTRDLIEERALVGGGAVVLIDTGGIMPPGSVPLASAVRAKVLSVMEGCSLLLFVVDGRRGLLPLEEDLARLFRESDRPLLLVVNKVDTYEGGVVSSDFARLGFGESLSISAEHGLGIAELHAAMEKALPAPGEAERDPPEIRVTIAGRPNVGKSSLLNALLKSERSLVSEIPGTTRDPVDSILERKGRVYRFIDTAGMRRRGRVEHGAEALSVAAARRSVGDSDVTLVLVDASAGLVAQDLHVLGLVTGGERGRVRPLVVLLNKADLLGSREEAARRVEDVRERLKFAPFAPIVPISALKRLHLDRIFTSLDAVYADSLRYLPTTELNDWLHSATTAHHPPPAQGKPLTFVFITQTGARPPAFMVLTNRAVPPHFSYARYLENSLRRRFGLKLTPIVLRFRGRTRSEPGRSLTRRGGGI
jgi:GTP-binding protein